jgi:uncharacterized protein YndB with AHSA1/START domain
MNPPSTDRIEKKIELTAPIGRVWKAITDYQEFGQWFRAKLETPFIPGKVIRGRITYPGYEHLTFEVTIEKMEPERLFSLRWHPNAIDPKKDYSSEPTTLVEFKLEKIATGTLLTLTESGFDQIPAERRAEAFRNNSGGWEIQMKNIDAHVTKTP